MRFQLVLQFKADKLADFDSLVAFEEVLSEELWDFANVDGHDFSSGEFNIFILTDDPRRAFEVAEKIVHAKQPSQELKAAYRELEGEEFILIWPPNLERFAVT